MSDEQVGLSIYSYVGRENPEEPSKRLTDLEERMMQVNLTYNKTWVAGGEEFIS